MVPVDRSASSVFPFGIKIGNKHSRKIFMTNIIHCRQVCEVLRRIMLYALHDQARNLSKTARSDTRPASSQLSLGLVKHAKQNAHRDINLYVNMRPMFYTM